MADLRRHACKRRSIVLLLIAWSQGLLSVLALPGTAAALGGGGVGGFGGGGGGGARGGGGFGGGRAFGGGGSGEAGGGGAALLILPLALIALYLLIGSLRQWWVRRHAERREPFSPRLLIGTLRRVVLWPIDLVIERRRLGRRRELVGLAAAEASEIDPRFAPEVVRAGAEQLFCAIQAAWTADNRAELARLVGDDLMVEWDRRLKAFELRGWTNRIDLEGPVHAEYVGLRNAAEDRSKRAIVRLTARVRDVVIDPHGHTIHRLNSISDTHHICEYWTLGLSDQRWVLLSIEQHHEGLHQLTDPILPSPWSDTKALQREATIEQAASARIDNSQVGAIAGATLTRDARAAALDISLVDDRFAPRVLACEAEYAVGAWTEAIDGEDNPLHAAASASAVQELLYPGDATSTRRVVVRGPRVRSVEILDLDARAMPPSMLVELHVSGRRYVENRDTTTILSGDRSVESSFTLRWRMELTDNDAHPWRIAAVEPESISGESRDIEPTRSR
jgi:predicted lipid-binding transport protein (Tim44 family)